jgi:hypothetical protein
MAKAGQAGELPGMPICACQQGVVVERLLEVRHGPLPVDGVGVEPAADLVVNAAVGHARECMDGLVASKSVVMGPGAGQQELDGQGLRELRRAAPAAVLPVIGAEQALHRLGGQVGLRGGATSARVSWLRSAWTDSPPACRPGASRSRHRMARPHVSVRRREANRQNRLGRRRHPCRRRRGQAAPRGRP